MTESNSIIDHGVPTEPAEAPVARCDERTTRLLAALGHLWMFINYFHPDTEKRINWGAALKDAIPKVRPGIRDDEYVAVINDMLAELKDPLTCFRKQEEDRAKKLKQDDGGRLRKGVPVIEAIDESTYLVRINEQSFQAKDKLQEALNHIAKQLRGAPNRTGSKIRNANDAHRRNDGRLVDGHYLNEGQPTKSVIVDLRAMPKNERAHLAKDGITKPDKTENTVLQDTSEQSFAKAFDDSDLARALISRTVTAPLKAFRFYYGFEPANGSTSGGYHKRKADDRPAKQFKPLADATQPKVVFIINAFTDLPSVALAMQAEGLAYIIADGTLRAGVGHRSHVVTVEDLGFVEVRISELVGPGDYAGPFRPNETTARSSDPSHVSVGDAGSAIQTRAPVTAIKSLARGFATDRPHGASQIEDSAPPLPSQRSGGVGQVEDSAQPLSTEHGHAAGNIGHVYETYANHQDTAISRAIEVLKAGWTNEHIYKNTSTDAEHKRTTARKTFPDYVDRVTAAFRIAFIFKYFFPYNHLMEKTWDEILVQYLPKFQACENDLQYALAVAEMVRESCDSHVRLQSDVMYEFFGTAVPPINCRWIENSAVVTSIQDKSAAEGLKVGDAITEIDGSPVQEHINRVRPFSASTPQAERFQCMYEILRGPNQSVITLRVRNSEGSKTVSMIRMNHNAHPQRTTDRKRETIKLISEEIGYVDLRALKRQEVCGMFETLKNTRGIIFDMRGYPNGTAWEIAPRLLPSSAFLTEKRGRYQCSNVVGANFKCPVNPPEFGNTFPEFKEMAVRIGWSSEWKYPGVTVMLIDERAMSQAEHTGLMLRAANGTVFIGSATTGANGDVTNFNLPGGISVYFTGQAVEHADGTQLQRKGLQPDIEVHPTIEGIRQGRDEVLERAIEYLLERFKRE